MNLSLQEIVDLSACYYFHAQSFGEATEIYIIFHLCIIYLNSSLQKGPVPPNMGMSKNTLVSFINNADTDLTLQTRLSEP